MDAFSIVKYPRTPHVEGSRLQPGDEDLRQVPFAAIAGQTLVVEEKCDGANTAISFDASGKLLLQSRGHYLTGGYRERHYQLLKTWADAQRGMLYGALGARYVMYGEWLYAKHTVYYNALPHYFMEFDVLDRETGLFLSTPARRALLGGLPIFSAPVLANAAFPALEKLTALLGPSRYIREGHMADLAAQCLRMGLDAEKIARETDPSRAMEGLYLKLEGDGRVKERLKFVRGSFLQCVEASASHWLDRPIVPNGLLYPVDALFAPALPEAKA